MGQYADIIETYTSRVNDLAHTRNAERNAAWVDRAAAVSEAISKGDPAAARAAKAAQRAAAETAVKKFVHERGIAWAALGAGITDPLGKWIIENCSEHPAEAVAVLGLLPAGLRDLDALADAQEWCGIWSEFRTRALRDGVISEHVLAGDRKALHNFVNNICCSMSPRQTIELDRLLDEFAAKARQ